MIIITPLWTATVLIAIVAVLLIFLVFRLAERRRAFALTSLAISPAAIVITRCAREVFEQIDALAALGADLFGSLNNLACHRISAMTVLRLRYIGKTATRFHI